MRLYFIKRKSDQMYLRAMVEDLCASGVAVPQFREVDRISFLQDRAAVPSRIAGALFNNTA